MKLVAKGCVMVDDLILTALAVTGVAAGFVRGDGVAAMARAAVEMVIHRLGLGSWFGGVTACCMCSGFWAGMIVGGALWWWTGEARWANLPGLVALGGLVVATKLKSQSSNGK